MLCNSTQKKLDLPHEPGAWITVRALGFEALEAAREARSLKAIRRAREFGAELMSGLRGVETPTPTVAAVVDPLNDYDIGSLLEAGIVAWSYDAPRTVHNIASLDEKTARFVARALIPEPETEEDRGNDSAPSTQPLTA